MTSPTALLADELLPDGGVAKFIADRRAENTSWRRIARDLLETTNGRVDVTEATLRKWAAEMTSSQATAVAVPRPASEMAAAS